MDRTHRIRARACVARPALPRVEKPALVRCLGPVDVEALRAPVGRLSEKVWRQEDTAKENDYFCFTHTRHIVFRFIEGNRTPLRYYSKPIWTVWQRLLPVMAQGPRRPVATPSRSTPRRCWRGSRPGTGSTGTWTARARTR